jgi:hypothetical protein
MNSRQRPEAVRLWTLDGLTYTIAPGPWPSRLLFLYAQLGLWLGQVAVSEPYLI